MEIDPKEIKQLIQQTIREQLRIGTGTDFHSLHKGYPLVLAGIPIPFEKGFRVKRSDGDPVSHAVVDALLAALNQGDISDWFSDEDSITGARSIDYLEHLYKNLLQPTNTHIISVQVTILAEQPKLKPFFTKMREEIATRLHIEPQQVSVQGKTYEGKSVIGQQEGIEVRSMVVLLYQIEH